MNDRPGFGLYVHWPFCQAKCPYCDFNSHVVRQVDHADWQEALAAEIRRAGRETEGRILDSIFFGGGTPSLMEPATVTKVIDTARETWISSNQIEVTLEANPSSVEAGRFSLYADAGVNRVSIGVQSLRDDHLSRLGRLHSAREARTAVALAQDIFQRVSFDLIYARQDQSLLQWKDELSEALDTGVTHLSLYQLSIEEGTAFGDRFAMGKLSGLPDEDLSADLYALTQEIMLAAGMPAYEISNHAIPGDESRHNLIYWTSGDWVAVGPGAHGRLSLPSGRVATEAHRAPSVWLEAVRSGSGGECSRQLLDARESVEEEVLMGMRIARGIPESRILPFLSHKINGLLHDGLLERSAGNLRATVRGRLLLNHVLREMLS